MCQEPPVTCGMKMQNFKSLVKPVNICRMTNTEEETLSQQK